MKSLLRHMSGFITSICYAVILATLTSCAPSASGLEAGNPSDSEKAGQIPAETWPVTRVVDGDTIKVKMGEKEETVRLIGVDTPETVHPDKPVQPYGKEASSFTKAQLEGKKVGLELDVEERDRYGRLLAYVYLEDEMFNKVLLREGYSQLMTIPPNVKYVEEFTQLQQQAREQNKGLWASQPSAGEEPADAKPGSRQTSSYDGGQDSSPITLVQLTDNVKQGSNASVTIQGRPGSTYSITVTYKSGASTAEGLEPKTAGSDGKVTWTWKVGSRTTPGTYPISISGDGGSLSASFTVVK